MNSRQDKQQVVKRADSWNLRSPGAGTLWLNAVVVVFVAMVAGGLGLMMLLRQGETKIMPEQVPSTMAAANESGLSAVEAEVIANIVAQKVGAGTLADDQLPREFLRRLANRIICESYEDQFRIVVDDGGAKVDGAASTQPVAPAKHVNDVRVIEREIALDVQAYRQSLKESRPALRGYRAPILNELTSAREIRDVVPVQGIAAAEVVSRGLARDGLLRTLRNVIAARGPEAFLESDASSQELLRTIGFPFDLLEHFELQVGGMASRGGARGMQIVRAITEHLANSKANEVDAMLQAARFDYRAIHTSFAVATESGEHDIGIVRAQLTRGDHWQGDHDGGSLHMLRQIVEALHDTPFVVSIEQKHVARLPESLSAWAEGDRARLTVVPEQLPVAQWAQDNGKAGVINNGEAEVKVATLVPRFASRGDDGSTFVPGETFLADGLHAAGLNVIQSPLLFQGGNVLAIRHPKTGERILLVGEAEIYRNTALGLSESQALEAFRIEFGVDRVHKIPATSFHLDVDVTIRACGDELVAFINDDEGAARIILQCGLDALAKAGRVDAVAVNAMRAAIASGDRERIASAGWSVVQGGGAKGHLPLSLAKAFSGGNVERREGGGGGGANLQRFWLAVDLMCSRTANLKLMPDPNFRAYYEALLRMRHEQEDLQRALSELGLKVVAVPSLAHGARSVNYLNGIHARGMYLMPAYGGIYAPLDDAARAVFAAAMGAEVKIIPIYSAESQQRQGAVHCSYSVLPRLHE